MFKDSRGFRIFLVSVCLYVSQRQKTKTFKASRNTNQRLNIGECEEESKASARRGEQVIISHVMTE